MTGFLWSDDSGSFFGESPKQNRKPTASGSGKKQSSAPKTSPTTSNAKPGASSESPLNVTQLNAWVKRALDESLSTFWLVGEIGTLTRSAAGHVYLTIKDDTNQIQAVIWRSTLERIGIDLREGMAVLCQGRIDVYGPRGTYQIVVSKMEEQGLGALQIAFRRLHKKLEAEGLFREDRKKPLPPFPSRIGFVTSPHGAAIRDFIEVLRRRWPGASVLIIPAKVQGEGSAEDIAYGIQIASEIRPALDVLVVGRGGGSMEDLWSFNEEIVVRALAACPLPTVSAVGHEIDVTLCDLAADVRALTPSEAAELIVPNRDEIMDLLRSVRMRIDSLVSNRISQSELRIVSLASRPIFSNPERLIEPAMQKLDELQQAADLSVEQSLQLQMQKMERLAQVLEAISPLKTLARGYTVTTDAATGHLIKSIEQARLGHIVSTRLADGEFTSEIIETRSN